jgi:hypothetical protein
MTFNPFAGIPNSLKIDAQVIHPGTITERGSTMPSWDPLAVTIETITGCLCAPSTMTETQPPRQGATIRWTLYVPPQNVTITTDDRIKLPGIDQPYNLDSPPQTWPNPDGNPAYQVLMIIDQQG